MFLDISKGFIYSEQDQPFQAEVVLEPQTVFGEEIHFDPVSMEGTYRVTLQDTVTIEGHLETKVHASCALCGEKIIWPISIDFNEIFTKTAKEIVDEEFLYEGKKLPLDHMTLTLCLLQLPMSFTCPDGCKESVEGYLVREESQPHSEEETGSYFPFAGLTDRLNRS